MKASRNLTPGPGAETAPYYGPQERYAVASILVSVKRAQAPLPGTMAGLH